MGHLVELGPITFPAISTKLETVLLEDGPCAGTHAQVPGDKAELIQRVGKPGGHGVDTQMFSIYRREFDPASPFGGGRFVYSGITIDAETLHRALRAMQADGHTYGESHGA